MDPILPSLVHALTSSPNEWGNFFMDATKSKYPRPDLRIRHATYLFFFSFFSFLFTLRLICGAFLLSFNPLLLSFITSSSSVSFRDALCADLMGISVNFQLRTPALYATWMTPNINFSSLTRSTVRPQAFTLSYSILF